MNTQTSNTRHARSMLPCLAVGAAAWLASAPMAAGQCYHNPRDILAVDLNGDGRCDLVVCEDMRLAPFFGEPGHEGDRGGRYVHIHLYLSNGAGFQELQEFDYNLQLSQEGRSFVAGDINGDHVTDVAGAVMNERTEAFLALSDGNGMYYASAAGGADDRPALSVAIADLNHDGFDDVLQTTGSPDGIETVFGDPQPPFLSVRATEVNYLPLAIFLGQFDQDSNHDLIMLHPGATQSGDNAISISRGNGDGTFGPATFYGAGNDPVWAVVRDFNNDSFDDLAVANRGSDFISILFADGNGGFSRIVHHRVGMQTRDIDAGDLNGDGVLDLAVAGEGGTTYAILMGAGFGEFGEPNVSDLGEIVRAIVVGDFDGNGLDDVYVAGWTPAPFDGTYSNPGVTRCETLWGATPNLIRVSQQPISCVVPRGDSVQLSVTAASDNGAALSYQWRFAGRPLPEGDEYSGVNTRTLTIGRAEVDGRYEVLIKTADLRDAPVLTGATVSVAAPPPPGMCDAAFSTPSNNNVGANPAAIGACDINADGVPDLIATNFSSQSVSIAMGIGNGAFGPATPYPLGGSPWGFAIADLNSDGSPDLAISNHTTARLTVMLSNNRGQLPTQHHFATGAGPISVALGDFNADGILDAATANNVAGTVSVLRGIGDGRFLPAVNFAVGASPSSVAAGDLNNDGLLDLVVANSAGHSISLLLGAGNATFAAATSLEVGSGPTGVIVGDINGDAWPDIATSNFGDGTVSVLLGVGGASFASPLSWHAGAGPRHLALADLNGDSRFDLAVANSGSGSVSVLIGYGDGVFAPAMQYLTGDGASYAAIADLDADSRPDLAIANMNADSISILRSSGSNPGFAQQPQNQSAPQGASATFTVSPVGTGPFQYQWRRDGVPIVGATLSSLTVSRTTPSTIGSYDVQIRGGGGCNGSSVVTSRPALLSIADGSCIADANRDGLVTSQDFFNFVTAFFAGCP